MSQVPENAVSSQVVADRETLNKTASSPVLGSTKAVAEGDPGHPIGLHQTAPRLELVRRLLRADKSRDLRVDPELPGWVTNGFWATWVGDLGDLPTTNVHEAGALRRLVSGEVEGVRLREDRALRMPRIMGVREIRVGKCDGCECGECEGRQGHMETEPCVQDAGQAVFVDGGGRGIVINPDFAPLLDGLDVYATCSLPPDPRSYHVEHPMLLGIDDKGEVVALVMPVRAKVRTERAAEQVVPEGGAS
jgi:hypothetical protein